MASLSERPVASRNRFTTSSASGESATVVLEPDGFLRIRLSVGRLPESVGFLFAVAVAFRISLS
jgi:hypothetical protein